MKLKAPILNFDPQELTLFKLHYGYDRIKKHICLNIMALHCFAAKKVPLISRVVTE